MLFNFLFIYLTELYFKNDLFFILLIFKNIRSLMNIWLLFCALPYLANINGYLIKYH